MRNVEIKEINFLTVGEKELTKNYPSSGLFISKIYNEFTDFVFVDKDFEFVTFICPEEKFKSIFKDQKELNVLESNTEKYSGDFILEFARILLNRK